MKQDKARGVVILNRKIYIKKCYKSFKTGQFKKLETDPIETVEENCSECSELLRTRLLKENTNDYIQLAQNPAHSMEMLRYIN